MMPRKSRIDAAGAIHHVMVRGIDRFKSILCQEDTYFLELGLRPEEVWAKRKYQRIMEARSLVCQWAVRELGVSMSSLAVKLEISMTSVSESVTCGQRIAQTRGCTLIKP